MIIFLLFFLLLNLKEVFGTSIWKQSPQESIFSDQVAKRPGDVVVILLVEEAEAESKFSTDRGKGGELSAEGEGLIKFPKIEAEGKSKYKSSGRTTRKQEIKGKIVATVVKVLENGNLMVEGNKLIKINNEQESMTIFGIARPQDISSDNTILSSKLAELRIEYRGNLKLTHKERPGIFTRLITAILGILF